MTAFTATSIAARTAVPARDPLAARQAALRTLDADVRPLLERRLLASDGPLRPSLPPVVDLTVYDAVYAGTPAGGHWTVAVRRPTFVGHQVASYAITLEFDAAHRPARFQVSGAADVVSDDASLDALDRALIRAGRAGPITTWAPNFIPGISL